MPLAAITPAKMTTRQGYWRRKVSLARERERQKIAGELHDGLCQDFVSVKIVLEGLVNRLKRNRSIASSPSAGKLIFEIERAIQDLRESVEKMRGFMEHLVVPVPPKNGFFNTLKIYVERFNQKHKIKTKFIFPEKKYGFARDKEIVLFRIIQEALLNIVKHSRADQVWVHVLQLKDNLIVAIKDNGVGLQLKKTKQCNCAGLGLFFMQERCAYLGGKFAIHSKVGQGTKILISIPVDKMY